MTTLTQERLKELFNYNPDTGIFTLRQYRGGRIKIDEIAGFKSACGYILIKVDGKKYFAQRLVWLYMTGNFPKDQADHINHDRCDNRFSNIRDATRLENNRNASIRKDNSSGVAGVSWSKRERKWKAYISTGGRREHIGTFSNICEAVDARSNALKKYGYHENHGQ